jgi:acyl carrier protein
MSTEKLKTVFSKVFNLSDMPDDLQYQGIAEWDSIGHMALISALDEEFDIMLDTDDVIDMSSFLKAKEILKKYGVKF